MRFFLGLLGARSQIEAAEKSRLLDVISENRKLRAELTAEHCWRQSAQAISDALRAENDQLRVQLANVEAYGPRRTLEKMNDAQAARAMSRQTKQHFQAYQGAVKVILDEVERTTGKNHIGPEDHQRLRNLRKILSELIGRSI